MIDIAKAREALDNIGLNFTVFHLLQSRDIKTLSDFINEVEAALKAEPVMVYDGRCIWDCGDSGHHDVTPLKIIAKGTKLYATPLAAHQTGQSEV
jgi:hypothetical protein